MPLSMETNDMLKEHEMAPSFEALDQNRRRVRLTDFRRRQNVVLYFYPKDDTPGCTVEASQFSALTDEFANVNTVVLGVSRDSWESHRAFIANHGLRVTLLSDTAGVVCERYGVWQVHEKNGEREMGIVRSTFLIDRDGRLASVEYGVSADGHASQMLEKASAL